MKKIISVALVVVLSLAMTMAFGGCKSGGSTDSGSAGSSASSSGDAYELYTAANKKVQDAEGFSATTDLTMGLSIGGQSMDIQSTGDIICSKVSDSDIQLKMDQEMTISGAAIQLESYYKDGYMYTSMMGMKTKVKTPLEQAMAAGQNPNFKKEDIKDSTVVSGDDGNTVLNFTITGDGLKDVVMQNMPSTVTSGASAGDFTFTDAKIVATIDKDGNIISSEMNTTFTMDVMGQKIDSSMDIKTANIKTGAQAITYPTDLDTYTEAAA